MNEILLCAHIAIISLAALGALRLGKEALTSYVCILSILCNFFVTKQITLFGLTATASDALAIGTVLGLNLLQEYFGKQAARLAIWLSFASGLLYIIMAQCHLYYKPSAFDTSDAHFFALLSPMPRIIIASLCTYLIAQRFDYYLFGVFKKIFPQTNFVLRNYCSAALSQLLDTILFSFLGLYGLVDSIIPIIIISYAIKLCVIIGTGPFLWFTKKIIDSAAPHHA